MTSGVCAAADHDEPGWGGFAPRGARSVRMVSRLRSLAAWTPLAFVFAGSLVAAAMASARPTDAVRLAAIFPPWWSAERALAAASSVGPVAGSGRLPFIVAVSGAGPGAGERLKSSGALFVVDGSRFSFCVARQKLGASR